jgi:hypothetical protein
MLDARYPAAHLNPMTITMLGVSQSGKSTYILGAYDELVHGVHDCFLHSADPDAGAKMDRELNTLRAGKAPPQTPDTPVHHDFVLTMSGSAEQTSINLTDFRGGAAFDVTRGKQDGDVAQLHRRLVESDSIFVVLDSANFREPVTPWRLQAVREATGTDRFSDLIGKALADRHQASRLPPSIAILMTKADLVDGGLGSTYRDWAEIHDEVRGLLGVAFQPHLTTAIFPVSVGDFGAEPNGEFPAAAIALRDTANPWIFAVGWFLQTCQFEIQRLRDQAQTAGEDAASSFHKLTSRPPIVQWFQKSRIAATRAALEEANAQVAALDTRLNDLGWHSQALLSTFETGTGANEAMGTGRLRPDR